MHVGCSNTNFTNCEVREKTNKMQQLDVYFQQFLNMFRASLCPSSGEQDVCYCMWCGVLCCNKRGKLDISFNVFFVWYCVVNLDGISCVYENVVCKLVCRGVGLVYVSRAFQVWCNGVGALMHELYLFDGMGVWCRCY